MYPLSRKPFLDEDKIVRNLTQLIEIESEIENKLNGYENFAGIDFCDVGAKGIQIRGYHNEVTGYSYGNQITIKYDFSNYKECIDLFVEMWKRLDNPSDVSSAKSFIRSGEKYGWD